MLQNLTNSNETNHTEDISMDLVQIECTNSHMVHVQHTIFEKFSEKNLKYIKESLSDTQLKTAIDLSRGLDLNCIVDDKTLIKGLGVCTHLKLEISEESLRYASNRLAKGSKFCSIIYNEELKMYFFGESLGNMPHGKGTVMHSDGRLQVTYRNPVRFDGFYRKLEVFLRQAFSKNEISPDQMKITLSTTRKQRLDFQGGLDLLFCKVVQRKFASLLQKWEVSQEEHVKKSLIGFLRGDSIIDLVGVHYSDIKNVLTYCNLLFVESGCDISTDCIVGTGHRWQISFLKKLNDKDIMSFLNTAIELDVVGVCSLKRAILDTFEKCSTKTNDGWKKVAHTHCLADLRQWRTMMAKGIMKRMHTDREKQCEIKADNAMRVFLDYEYEMELKKKEKAATKQKRKRNKNEKKRKIIEEFGDTEIGYWAKNGVTQTENSLCPENDDSGPISQDEDNGPISQDEDDDYLYPQDDVCCTHTQNQSILVNELLDTSAASTSEWLGYMRKDGIWEGKDKDFSSFDIARVMNMAFPVDKDSESIYDFMQQLDLYQSRTWDIFMREGIDMTTLPMLTTDDFNEIGVQIGPRKKIQLAIHSK